MKKINLYITNEIQGDGVSLGAEGTHDFVTLRMTFDSSWDDTSKTVTFQDAKGLNPVFVIITSSMKVRDGVYDVPVPAEPMLYAGEILVSVKGYETEEQTVTNDDDEEETVTVETYAIVTANGHFFVQPSCYDSSAAESEQPTPTLAEQLQDEIDEITEQVQTATNARRWVDGKKADGTDVETTDAAYHNNALYYKGLCETANTSAQTQATNAASSATAAAASKTATEQLAQTAIRAYPLTEKTSTDSGTFTISANTCVWYTSAGALTVTLGSPVSGYENEWRLVVTPDSSSSLTVTVPTGYTLKWESNLLPAMTSGKLYEISFYLTPGSIIRGSFGEVDV